MRTLSMHIVTYLIKYLGEFKFIFETILDYESGDQMGSFDAKNSPSKISCLGTLSSVSLVPTKAFSTILWKEATAAMTALVYSILHTRIYRGYVHVY
jgi:hypothetical protein